MYRSMVGVGLGCALLIVTVFEVTRPVIVRNEAAALQRAIFDVLPAARTSMTFRAGAEGRFERLAPEAPGGASRVFAGYDEQGRLVGLAIEAQGMGYQDVIRLIYGYDVARQAIVGIRVLESRETPGLGDRIGSDPDFLRNFERLDVSLAADGEAIAQSIVAVKHGAKRHDWEIDGITGATISCQAVADMLQTSASQWVPRLRRRISDFEQAVEP
jgi:electron transport complex protein RnfG